MNKHIALPATLATLLLLGACTAATPSIDSESDDASSAPVMMNDAASSSDAPAAAATSGEARIIEMSVTDWEFSIKNLDIKQGEKVIVRLTDIEGGHSFTSQDLGINVTINPGETKDIEIPTGKTGTFNFRCTVPCGPGHRDMKGTITIS